VPGIAVSLASGAAAVRLAGLLGGGPAATGAVEAALLVALAAAGIPICARAARLLGRGKDPGAIVFDEMAALPMALLAVPPAARSAAVLGTAFVLFRFFDVTKPFPARQLERLPEGWGIMADDWAAAGWAAAVLAAVRAAGWV
jgi:phosphatidylglycerophosphatase A